MVNKPKRIVIDTNLFISFLISDSFNKLEEKLKFGNVRIVISIELLNEFLEVVSRPKFKKYFSDRAVTMLLEGIQDYADLVEVTSNVNLCRDKKDDFLLNLCIDGKVDYLVTGDKDLLELKKYKRTTIITINEYLRNKKGL